MNKFIFKCLLVWINDDVEKFNETWLLAKEDFYSHLNMEDSTDADYTHVKRVCKDFEIKIPYFL